MAGKNTTSTRCKGSLQAHTQLGNWVRCWCIGKKLISALEEDEGSTSKKCILNIHIIWASMHGSLPLTKWLKARNHASCCQHHVMVLAACTHLQSNAPMPYCPISCVVPLTPSCWSALGSSTKHLKTIAVGIQHLHNTVCIYTVVCIYRCG